MNKQRQVIVIGAGASGLMAAITAAEHGAGVLVLEHMDSAGKKLLLTGKGRCNYTNTDVCPKHYHSLESYLAGSDAGSAPQEFMEPVLSEFDHAACLDYFRTLGIEPEIRHYRFDHTGYVYPREGGASKVLDALMLRAELLGVRFLYGVRISTAVRTDDGSFALSWHRSVHGHTAEEQESCDALIIATGSNAYPDTGSDSSVYSLLKELGLSADHTGFLPALCALYSKDPLLSEWKGQRVEGTVSLLIDGRETSRKERGEIQFNEHSISGIPVMQLSGLASSCLKNGRSISLSLQIPDADDPGRLLMDHVFPIHRTAGFERAQCCTGGIRLHTVEPSCMESMHVRDVYFCGEILDIDGDCGGYNLHFAWASGRLAGRCAADPVRDRF